MSPCGDIAAWVQRWNGSPLIYGAGLLEMPSVKSTLPSNVHWRTVWSPSSVSQIVSSGAMNTPCAGKQAFAERTEKVAVAIEHDHRMLAAIEDVDVVVLVDSDAADFLK